MKCPFLSVACATSQLPLDEVTDECLKEECAWWSRRDERCLALSISGSLYGISQELSQLTALMPTYRQF